MQGFLDLYMVRARRFKNADIDQLRALFSAVVDLGQAIYQDHFLHPWDAEKEQWASRPQRAFADAVLVGLSRCLSQADAIVRKRQEVIDETRRLFETHPKGTFTGAANTKKDNQRRIELFEMMLNGVLNS
jgi:hypothetical protein